MLEEAGGVEIASPGDRDGITHAIEIINMAKGIKRNSIAQYDVRNKAKEIRNEYFGLRAEAALPQPLAADLVNSPAEGHVMREMSMQTTMLASTDIERKRHRGIVRIICPSNRFQVHPFGCSAPRPAPNQPTSSLPTFRSRTLRAFSLHPVSTHEAPIPVQAE